MAHKSIGLHKAPIVLGNSIAGYLRLFSTSPSVRSNTSLKIFGPLQKTFVAIVTVCPVMIGVSFGMPGRSTKLLALEPDLTNQV